MSGIGKSHSFPKALQKLVGACLYVGTERSTAENLAHVLGFNEYLIVDDQVSDASNTDMIRVSSVIVSLFWMNVMEGVDVEEISSLQQRDNSATVSLPSLT
jgi:hypothetical protein